MHLHTFLLYPTLPSGSLRQLSKWHQLGQVLDLQTSTHDPFAMDLLQLYPPLQALRVHSQEASRRHSTHYQRAFAETSPDEVPKESKFPLKIILESSPIPILKQIQRDWMHISTSNDTDYSITEPSIDKFLRKHPHPSATFTSAGSNKCLCKLFRLWSSQQPHKIQQNENIMYYIYVRIGRETTKLPWS